MWHKDMKWTSAVWKSDADRFSQFSVAMNFQFVKISVSTKSSQRKLNKMRCAFYFQFILSLNLKCIYYKEHKIGSWLLLLFLTIWQSLLFQCLFMFNVMIGVVQHTFAILLFVSYIVAVQLLSWVQLFATQWAAAQPSFTISLSLLGLMSVESVMPSNHLILCCPLLLPPSIFPQIRVFSQWVGSWHQMAKVLELQLQHQSFLWIFRVDFL